MASLARVQTSLGAEEAAFGHIAQSSQLAPASALAAHVRVQGLALAGEEDAALAFALEKWAHPGLTFEPGMRGALRHMIVGLFLRQGTLAEAEEFLLEEFPDLPTDFGTPDAPPRRYPAHAVQSLAHLYRATGRVEQADRLANYARQQQQVLLPEASLEMSAVDHWIAAAVEIGYAPESEVLTHLREAFFGGFQLDWRFNYYYHPIFQPLWQSEGFANLIAEFEAEAGRQRELLIP